ncbi:TPA: type 4b pilus protein PilO2 [Escherichia coli]|nr:type 4b pilus protein PilO2 [Escherichia coli]HAW3270004.1 type 4b pilus protein PilO2 [Escherichia coli]HAX4763326.1 type 4b pilus protein PilO2 [Escherichia coli]
MSTSDIIPVTLPGRRPGRPGRRIAVIAGLEWKDIPAGQSTGRHLPPGRGQFVKLRADSGGTHVRVGFTRSPGRLYSLAVLAIPALKGNGYAFVRYAGERIAFVACLHDMPALTGDVTGNAAQVSNACTVFRTMHDRDEPPDGWVILGSPEAPVDIQDVLPSTLPGKARLHPVNQAIRLVTLGVLGIALAGSALWGYSHWQEEQRLRQLQAMNLRQMQAAQQNGPERQAEPHPWPQLPLVQTFLDTCIPALRALHVSEGGWQLTAAECTPDTLRADYERPKGSTVTYEDFRRAITQHNRFSFVTLQDGGEKAQAGYSLTMTAGTDESLQPVEQHLARFLAPFQRGDRPLQMETEKIPDIAGHTVTIGDREVLLFRDWQQWQFSLEERLQPDAALFTQPGTRLTAVTLLLSEDGELTWKTRGQTWATQAQQPTESTSHE